jgi:UDP-N-acetylmuramoylalanine--D-glutamate ligase
VITSISENHLDWHKSFSEYIFSKRNILKRARRAVVHYDMEYKELFTHENITYFSLNSCEKLLGDGRSFVYIKDDYVYYNEKRLFPLDTIKLKGKHNILNVLASIGATYPYVKIEKIIDAVSHFSGVAHRSTEVEKINGITFVDSSVDSTPTRTITTLGLFAKEKSILILGGQDKCLSYLPLKDALSGVKLAVIFGINKEKIQNAINGACRFALVNNIFEATNLAYKRATNGDYIILSPASASFDMFENYIDRAEKFKEAIRGIKDAEGKGNAKYPSK